MIVALALVLAASAAGQVNLPEGFEIVEFAVSDKRTDQPAINDCGEIVYVKDKHENSRVFLYDNGKITRLTDYDKGRLVLGADINDAGTIVWGRGVFDQYKTFRVVMLRNGEQTVVGKGFCPSINSLGHVVWNRFRNYTCEFNTDIMFFDGQSVRWITHDRFSNQSPKINDRDQIVWTRYDFCVFPYVSEIRLYHNGLTVTLPSSDPQDVAPAINNLIQVAWSNNLGIELWEDGNTKLLTDWGGGPELNNLGDIFFFRWHDELRSDDAWLYRVSDGNPTFHRLTEDSVDDTVGDINDWGEPAWRWFENPRQGNWGGGVRFLRRIRTGDAEFDGDVDLVDYATFADCITGPRRVDRLCDCRFLDIDHDGDVDLGDFALFQNGFTRK